MQKFKAWEDLTFTDDFMFSQVMKNKEIFVRCLLVNISFMYYVHSPYLQRSSRNDSQN